MYQWDGDCCINCVYQKNDPFNKKYSSEGIVFVKNVTRAPTKNITKSVQIKLKVPDAHVLISLDEYDSPIIFKTIHGMY